MTPDIHTKTYAERSGLGGIGSNMGGYIGIGGSALSSHAGSTNMQNPSLYLHQSAKTNKNQQQIMGLTISGMNNSSLGAGNNSNMGHY